MHTILQCMVTQILAFRPHEHGIFSLWKFGILIYDFRIGFIMITSILPTFHAIGTWAFPKDYIFIVRIIGYRINPEISTSYACLPSHLPIIHSRTQCRHLGIPHHPTGQIHLSVFCSNLQPARRILINTLVRHNPFSSVNLLGSQRCRTHQCHCEK